MTIQSMRFACWTTKATNTHTEYVILTDFSTATMVAHELASTLRYTYIACIVNI